jgi:ComF family protein
MVVLAPARMARVALDLLYPPRCVLCRRGGAFVCPSCVASLPEADGARCPRCWLPLHAWQTCRACAEFPLAFTRLRAAFRYEGEVRRLLHAFKFAYQSCLGAPLAALVLANADRAALATDVIVPVPLTGARLRERGFNQAELLAREIGRALDLPVKDSLSRRGHGRHNARAASREERLANVRGVFSVSKREAIPGRRVLLVDDLATTGATLDACARALLEAGAGEISAITLARED